MLLEALATIGIFFGSLIVGAILLCIVAYVWAIVKTNKERKSWNNRYYR